MPKSYQLKITIKNSHPPIWRRVLVPDGITFRDLDEIIEELFGWAHDHMFEFSFRNNTYFIGTPIPDKEDTVDRMIDGFMKENLVFSYTYDFGDDWVHTIKVEKIVERAERFPEVLTSKGPNMIEDCGGLWGFYDYIDDAEPFDIDAVNEKLSTWIYPVNDKKSSVSGYERNFSKFSNKNEEPDYFDDFLSDFFDMVKDEESLNRFFENMNDMEENLRKTSEEIQSLTDVFQQYSKDDLKQLAQLHNFTRYSRFNKKELAEWLKNSLLETQFMREILRSSSEEEFRTFESAMKENGILIPEDVLSNSPLLCTYGGYNAFSGFLQIPLDVQEKYKKICTPEFYEELNQNFLLIVYLRSAIYLYGAISIDDLEMLYEHYEGKKLPAAILQQMIDEIREYQETYCIVDNILMDEDLAEHDLYQNLLKVQSAYPKYIPDDRQEFLHYGDEDSQMLGEDTAFFIDYLTKTMGLEQHTALRVFLSIEDGIRMNATEDELLSALTEYGCKLTSQKKIREVQKQLRKFSSFIRTWDFNGHNRNEINALKQPVTPRENSKIVTFPGKKIYPNDPCPCGSGKKYKHCCGKK